MEAPPGDTLPGSPGEKIVKLIRRGRLGADEGEKDLKALDARIAEREQKLAALGKVIELPPLDLLKKQMAEIYDPRDEPKTYEERRLVLEGLQDLRLDYYDGVLEITGKVPVVAASSQKNCHRGLRADSETQRQQGHNGKAATFRQRSHAIADVLNQPCQCASYIAGLDDGCVEKFRSDAPPA